MRQTHQPGEKGFVDYCEGLPLVERESGQQRLTQLFVGVLGASGYTFVIASPTQSIPDWTWAHVRFFEFLGRVPAIIVPDNLKSAVKQPCHYDPVINPSFQE